MILRPFFIPTWKYQPEVAAKYPQSDINAGNVAERSVQHVDKFVRDCKEAGIWSKFLVCLPFIGNNLSCAIRDLVSVNGTDAINFVSGDFSEATGLTGNGSTKYLALGITGTDLPAACHFSFYQRTDNAQTGNRSCIGLLNSGATDQWWLGSLNPSIQVDGRLGLLADATNAAQMIKGFYLLNRDTPTSLKLQRNANTLDTNSANVAGTPANISLMAWAWNNNTTPGGYNSATGSFLSAGASLTTQQRTDFYTIVQTLQTNLGRAV